MFFNTFSFIYIQWLVLRGTRHVT